MHMEVDSVKMELPGGPDGNPKEVQVRLHFLCGAGALLQLSKYVASFQLKMENDSATAAFGDVVLRDFAVSKAKQQDQGQFIYKMDALLPLLPYFKDITRTVASYKNISDSITSKGVDQMEKEQAFFGHVMNCLGSFLALGLQECSNEVGSVAGLTGKLFKQIAEAHALPSIFQASKVERNLVARLVGDPEAQKLLFVGTKAGKCCNHVKEFLEGIQSLPNGSALTPSLVTMVEAVHKDLSDFGGNQNEKSMLKNGEKFRLANFSWFQGSLTLAQVLTRQLNPGETRLGLASRCLNLIKTQGTGCEPALLQAAQQLQAGK